MKIKSFLLIIFAVLCSTAFAAPLSPEAAMKRVIGEWALHRLRAQEHPRYIGEIYGETEIPTIYLFTYSGNEGFMLLAADDAVPPLLGYSESGSFALDQLDDNVSSWLSLYSVQIEDARLMGLSPAEGALVRKTRAGEKAPIGPLLTTTWDQTTPYNNLCPVSDKKQCVTGCVATAMAQVMNYWEYPPVGNGEITFSPATLDQDLYLDFSTLEFDWANMLDSYRGVKYNNTEATAVATLMMACGYSVRMGYTPGSSGARSDAIGSALTNYFGYDRGTTFKERSSVSSEEAWADLIYNDLVNVGPVILDGQAPTGGHCFVCDGYDGDGYFHINWGWSGMSDGYFLLNLLNPSDVGTGGHYGGYNMTRDAIIGIMPPVGRLSLNEFSVDGAASDSGIMSGKGYIYRVNDFSNIKLSLSVRVSGGHISSPIYIDVYETDPNTLKNGDKILETTFNDNLNASDGDVEYSTTIGIGRYDVSQFYTVNISYDLKGQRQIIGNLRLAASSGVSAVTSEVDVISIYREGDYIKATTGNGTVTLTVYDLGGKVVQEACGESPSADTRSMGKGVYMVTARGDEGYCSSKKLLLR